MATTETLVFGLAALSIVAGGCSTPPSDAPLPPDDGRYARTYFIDPVNGRDDADGLSEGRPLRSLDPLAAFFPPPDTKIAIRRGTVLRLNATVVLRGGTAAGWLCYGAYGDPSAPKPVLVGSVAIAQSSWSMPDADGVRTFDWRPFRDAAGGRSLSGVEQGPGNLWFFEGAGDTDRMAAFGYRHGLDVGAGSQTGDWYYDPALALVRLRWPLPMPPALTEASVNRTMLS
ncbi:MAG: hypothetical protein WCJ30_21240 [Deltaproteobacteria bacterium]